MPVTDLHPEHLATLPLRLRARDVLAGEDAVKAAGIKYLPRLDSQSDAEYAAYVQRAAFFNAAGRTAAGYVGQIFCQDPVIILPLAGPSGAALAGFLADVDLPARLEVQHEQEDPPGNRPPICARTVGRLV